MIDYSFYSENNFVLSILYGPISSDEFSEWVEQLALLDNQGSKILGLTVLCKNTIIRNVKYSDILAAGKRLKYAEFRNNSKGAIVANNMISYGLSQVYQIATEISGKSDTSVYKAHELSEAINWLGMSDMETHIQELVKNYESIRYA